jgi:hypothetical protein
MSSKIVIIGAGCASSMRARPAARSQHARNPRERLRAVGPAVCPAGGPGSRKRPPQVAASGDSGRDAQSARAPAARRIADRNQGHGDSQRITRPGSIITIRRAKRCHRADCEWRP